ncbi:MAG: DUF134 domain-containing protein [Planctomycetota bacterium]
MPRPQSRRMIGIEPACTWFKPAGVRMDQLEEVQLTLDEVEALRLADLEGLYQADAAARMGVSRPTLGRILTAARRKVAEALIQGKAMRLSGGSVCRLPSVRMCCGSCRQEWELPGGTPAEPRCPACGAQQAHSCDGTCRF